MEYDTKTIIGLIVAIFVVWILVIPMMHSLFASPAPNEPENPPTDNKTIKPQKIDTQVSRPITDAAAAAKALDPDDDMGDSWVDLIKSSELDPSVEDNHARFVRDATRFSSGANFTAVADDNTNLAFVNFVGLRRPSHVRIDESTARQIPDIDQNVLQRNKPFRFN